MNVIRKTIGLLILIFIGVPTLIGIIWSVGVTRAAVSPNFIADLPREIIEKVPDMIDDIVVEIDREDLMDEPNSRAWAKAVANAETSPKELLGKIGVLDWLENELSVSFQKMGDMLRGEIPLRPVVLNLRPLKEALQHEAITEYLVDILKSLPKCDEYQLKEWLENTMDRRNLEDLPACQPTDLASAAEAIRFVQGHEIDDIPDEVNLMEVEGHHNFPEGFDVAKTVVSLTYFLFLFPAVFIFMGSLIGGDGKPGVLQWMGVSTIVGGVLSYGLSSLIKGVIPGAVGFASQYEHGISSFEKLMAGKVNSIGMIFMDRLLEGVDTIAGMVCIIGILLFALSFLLTNGKEEQKQQKAEPKKKETVLQAEPVKDSEPEKSEAAPESEANGQNQLSAGQDKPDITKKEE